MFTLGILDSVLFIGVEIFKKCMLYFTIFRCHYMFIVVTMPTIVKKTDILSVKQHDKQC